MANVAQPLSPDQLKAAIAQALDVITDIRGNPEAQARQIANAEDADLRALSAFAREYNSHQAISICLAILNEKDPARARDFNDSLALTPVYRKAANHMAMFLLHLRKFAAQVSIARKGAQCSA